MHIASPESSVLRIVRRSAAYTFVNVSMNLVTSSQVKSSQVKSIGFRMIVCCLCIDLT